MKTHKIWIGGLLVLTLLACGKKEELNGSVLSRGAAMPAAAVAAAPASVDAVKVAGKSEGESTQKFLAYEHSIEVEVDGDKLRTTYQGLLDACLNDKKWQCTVLDSSLNAAKMSAAAAAASMNGEPLAANSATIRLRAKAEGVQALKTQLASTGGVLSQNMHVEDLASPVADVEKRIGMLKEFRQSLLTLQKKATKVEDLLAIAEKLAETQANLEAASGESAHLMTRINLETLSITLLAQHSSGAGLLHPIQSALSAFIPNLAEVVGNTIRVIPYLLPWLLLGAIIFMIVRRIRKYKNDKRDKRAKAEPKS